MTDISGDMNHVFRVTITPHTCSGGDTMCTRTGTGKTGTGTGRTGTGTGKTGTGTGKTGTGTGRTGIGKAEQREGGKRYSVIVKMASDDVLVC